MGPIPTKPTLMDWPDCAFAVRPAGIPTGSEHVPPRDAIGMVTKLLTVPPERTATGTKHPDTADGT